MLKWAVVIAVLGGIWMQAGINKPASLGSLAELRGNGQITVTGIIESNSGDSFVISDGESINVTVYGRLPDSFRAGEGGTFRLNKTGGSYSLIGAKEATLGGGSGVLIRTFADSQGKLWGEVDVGNGGRRVVEFNQRGIFSNGQ